MIFENALTEGRLIKRYKRFLADVELPDGSVVVAHCANSGSMLGCKEPGSRVYLSPNTNPKAKLDWRWEMVEVDGHLVGINTSHPNKLAEEAILGGVIPELAGYGSLRREVKYGQNSRIDILLEAPEEASKSAQCFVEVKNVTLKVGDDAQFPDAVTARGTKHLRELMDMVTEGHRAVMLYLVQRGDCLSFAPAADIDPTYAAALREAKEAGVETLCYVCDLSTEGIRVDRPMPMGF
ncbi:DNA/RNA nuclease SfsA [Kordiimonas lipolytica]|uniref:Sugar fermentation stimulation protein homolog n=1 Tax=Kordiimonas lipolytica TaxID=1662421 RepID=A0ABV8U8C9_9PROT|nr:DNA/RNA nuclease SfsA [Kordiimonas lipolytica]